MKHYISLLCVGAVLVGSVHSAESGGTWPLSDHNVIGLRCEFRVNPLGLDASRPRLSWVIESNDHGMVQTAYQVVVDGVWDTGKVVADQSQNIEYGGKPLVSGTRYDWKVRVWDNSGKVSKWSEPARWTMGLLKPEDWTARWISTEIEQTVNPRLRRHDRHPPTSLMSGGNSILQTSPRPPWQRSM